MANEHGYLPKVETLDPDNQRRLDTWYAKAYTDDNLFRTLARDETVMGMFLDWVKAMYGAKAELDPHMLELCRIRMARVNECFH
ncbi:MAG: hypothetical protein OEY23_05700 [Acidimicrobiia bacterium]|nr:hypothetical protein [Acidimicrobiia bacterium]